MLLPVGGVGSVASDARLSLRVNVPGSSITRQVRAEHICGNVNILYFYVNFARLKLFDYLRSRKLLFGQPATIPKFYLWITCPR